MMLITEILFYALGAYVFLFLFWRKLKEDYTVRQIFVTSLSSVVSTILLTLLLSQLNHNWWFWWAFFGCMFGLLLGIYKLNLRLFEIFDAFVYAATLAISVLYTLKFMVTYRYENGSIALVFFFLFLLFVFLHKNYKKFTWYASGRLGFSGLGVFILFFLTRFIVALFHPSMISFVGKGEYILSGGMFLTSAALLINLGRS